MKRSNSIRFVIAVAAIFVFAGAAFEVSAQRGSDTFKIVADDWLVGVAPGQTVRLTVFNPVQRTTVASSAEVSGVDDGVIITGGPMGHVRVFDGAGLSVFSSENIFIPPGEFRTFDIKYADLAAVPAESSTGRRQIRTDMTISFTGLESDARRFHPTFELVDSETGQTILIGMLLPAVQKVR